MSKFILFIVKISIREPLSRDNKVKTCSLKLYFTCFKTCYPQIENVEEKYKLLIKAVSEKTAQLIAKWQLIGWCHGVMNTDNMSIAGVTLDYGPFGFMDRFDPEFICNASDNRESVITCIVIASF